jgi:hypothetical protein
MEDYFEKKNLEILDDWRFAFTFKNLFFWKFVKMGKCENP